MSPDVLKIMAVTAGALVASPFMLASFRAFFFFGKMEQTAKAADAAIARIELTVSTFVASTETALADHEGRILVIEVERRTEAKFGRRIGDPKATGEVRAGSGP